METNKKLWIKISSISIAFLILIGLLIGIGVSASNKENGKINPQEAETNEIEKNKELEMEWKAYLRYTTFIDFCLIENEMTIGFDFLGNKWPTHFDGFILLVSFKDDYKTYKLEAKTDSVKTFSAELQPGKYKFELISTSDKLTPEKQPIIEFEFEPDASYILENKWIYDDIDEVGFTKIEFYVKENEIWIKYEFSIKEHLPFFDGFVLRAYDLNNPNKSKNLTIDKNEIEASAISEIPIGEYEFIIEPRSPKWKTETENIIEIEIPNPAEPEPTEPIGPDPYPIILPGNPPIIIDPIEPEPEPIYLNPVPTGDKIEIGNPGIEEPTIHPEIGETIENDSGLEGWEIFLITIGTIIGALLIGYGGYYYWNDNKKKRKGKQNKASEKEVKEQNLKIKSIKERYFDENK